MHIPPPPPPPPLTVTYVIGKHGLLRLGIDTHTVENGVSLLAYETPTFNPSSLWILLTTGHPIPVLGHWQVETSKGVGLHKRPEWTL